MTYLEYQFQITPVDAGRDILVAELGELGFESFVEQEGGLVAYIQKEDWTDQDLSALYIINNPNFKISWTFKEIEQQNWNAKWEENFSPITVNKDCQVRAPFHPKTAVQYDIVIEPKMSFGTGHHETTFMMLTLLLEETLDGKRVLDMGCGTGVLAILAEKRGASSLQAIDIDEWCVENTTENIQRNLCNNIQVLLGDSSLLDGKKFDVIIANINRNVLLADISRYAECLSEGGTLLLSGFYLSDLDMISAKCAQHNLQFEKKLDKHNWVAVKYVH